ncbi:hypothetical protein C8046_08650 [Serinibacter arcticus]|uniref:Uncharacterized protein n=1 Tax=Serinibacter arcticus TaxID=1655435 RepID=A0A2U1ZUR7_9MICO|nr:hypothetical protein [Serinibacter arcticus]PWD50709.1 hypothetical protein C8046_08650 [Serinibacter arcticus]
MAIGRTGRTTTGARRGTTTVDRGPGGGGRLVVALRTGDPRLVAAVRDVVEWLEGDVVVRPPGAPPVPAHAHLDDATLAAPASPTWGTTAIAVAVSAPDGDPAPTAVGVLQLPRDTGVLADAITVHAASSASRTVGVVGARGGVGASVTAALLARSAVDTGRSAGLVDLGGGLDVVLGIEDEPGPGGRT